MKRARSLLVASVLIFPFWYAFPAAPVPAAATAATAKSTDVTINGDNPWIHTAWT